MSDTIHLYVNMSGNTIPGTSFATIGEALASLPDVPASESGKQFPAPVSELPPVILYIGMENNSRIYLTLVLKRKIWEMMR